MPVISFHQDVKGDKETALSFQNIVAMTVRMNERESMETEEQVDHCRMWK